jgi:hypothetical protein
MSVEQLETLLKRAETEPGFAALIGADPDRRLRDYDLEQEEAVALLCQDVDKLREMGVDPELAENARFIGQLGG